ncbi:MAG: hypothetical protein ACU85V_00170 [Gammaproteobacteria bacterium]
MGSIRERLCELADVAKIARLKQRARRLAKKRAAFASHLDCGASMARAICGSRGDDLDREFAEVMDELRRIDPECPELPAWVDELLAQREAAEQ